MLTAVFVVLGIVLFGLLLIGVVAAVLLKKGASFLFRSGHRRFSSSGFSWKRPYNHHGHHSYGHRHYLHKHKSHSGFFSS